MFDKIISTFFDKINEKKKKCNVKENRLDLPNEPEFIIKTKQDVGEPKTSCLSLYFYKNKGLNVAEREFYSSTRGFVAR